MTLDLSLDPYKAQDALRRLDQAIVHGLTEARHEAAIVRAEYERAARGEGAAGDDSLGLLQDWRETAGRVDGLALARTFLIRAVREAKGTCRWCGGPDDHGQDCRPAPYGTLPRRIR